MRVSNHCNQLPVSLCASLNHPTHTLTHPTCIPTQGEWVTFWLAYYVTLSIGIVLAYFIAAISPNLDVANALLPTYVVTLLFFGGFLFRLGDIPPWWKWYSYIGEAWARLES